MTSKFKLPYPQSEDDVHDMLTELVEGVRALRQYCAVYNINCTELFLLQTATHIIQAFHHTIDIQELLSGKSTAHHSN